MNENRIKFIQQFYNPTAYDDGYELFIALATTSEVMRVPSNNYMFLARVALGYLLTEPNIYNIQINLWGEFVVKFQRLGNGSWQGHFGYGEVRMFATDEMLVGYLKGSVVAPAGLELNQ